MSENNRLTKIEQETIITFNEAEETAIVTTCNSAMRRRLEAYCQRGGCKKISGNEWYAEFSFPKAWAKILYPRQYTSEARAAMASRLRGNLAKSAI